MSIPLTTQTIQVEGLQNLGADSDKEEYSIKVASMKVNIQPSSVQTTVISDGAFGKTFDMFAPTTASGTFQGDRVTVLSGNFSGSSYIINGRLDWNLGGPLPHYEFVLFESNQ